MTDVRAILARLRPEVEAFLIDAVAAPEPSEPLLADLYGMLRYHLGWADPSFRPVAQRGGKMLRPAFCLLCCEAVGSSARRAVPAAVAIELFHNFSLIHDDVEDRSDERRGRPTVRALWGDPRAVNAGDALFVLSELALLRAPANGVDPALALTLFRELNRSFLAVAEGQHLDLTLEGNPEVTRDQYFAVIGRKTAELIGASARLGALSGGARTERAAHFHRFGVALGMAFQIQDDLLGIWGDPDEVGKGVAADVYGRKVTLPVIAALERATPEVAARLRQVYTTPEPTAEQVAEVQRALIALGGRAAAEAEVSGQVGRSLEELDAAEPEPGPAADLRALAQSLIGRTS